MEKELEAELNKVLGDSDQAEGQSESNEEEARFSTSEELSQEEEASGEETEDQEPTIEVGGRKFNTAELQEMIDKAKKYEELLPEFTKRSQKLAELERQFSQSSSPEEKAKAEALRYLRENLGLITKQDLEEFLNNFAQRLDYLMTEKERLNEAINYLSQKYDGTVFPKFNYDKLKEYLYQKYGEDRTKWPETIDLEYEYFQMNRDFFEKMPEARKKAIVTEKKGIPASIIPPSKKIVEKPTDKEEISLEDAMWDAIEKLGD